MHILYAVAERSAPPAFAVDFRWSPCRRRRLAFLTGSGFHRRLRWSPHWRLHWSLHRRARWSLQLYLKFSLFKYLRYSVFLICLLITFSIQVFYFTFNHHFQKVPRRPATTPLTQLIRPQTAPPPPSWKTLTSTSAPDPWMIRLKPTPPPLSSLSFTAIRPVEIFTVYYISKLHTDYFWNSNLFFYL